MKITFAILLLQALVAFAAAEEEKEQREGRVFPGAWSLLDSLRPVRRSEPVEGTRRLGSVLRRRVDIKRDENKTDTNVDVKTETGQAHVDTEDSHDRESKPTRTLVGRRRVPPPSAAVGRLEGKLLKERRIINQESNSQTEKGKSAYLYLDPFIDACSLIDCYEEYDFFDFCYMKCYSAYNDQFCDSAYDGLPCFWH